MVAAIDAEQVRNLRLYSDPVCRPLIEKLAQVYGLRPDQVFVSNGSDDILNFAFWAFAGQPGKGRLPRRDPYGFYQVFADLHQVEADVASPFGRISRCGWRTI